MRLLFLFALILAGCGLDSITTKEENLIGDVPAEKYYRQFLYKKDEGEALPYRYLSQSLTKIRTISDKENLYFTSSLYMQADGRYVLDYEEAQGNEVDGMLTTKPVFRKRLEGKWSVDKTALVIENVGRGAGLKYNEEDTVALVITSPIHDTAVKDKSAVYYYTQSNKGMPPKFQ